MKKIVPFCMAVMFIWGCSSTDPTITDTGISDASPVTGQKILLQVLSLSDNWPMTYAWQADQGEFVIGENTDNFAYWTAPENAGVCRITCTVTDDEDNRSTHVFEVMVRERSVKTLRDGGVLSLLKQKESIIGGAWISTQAGEVRYLSSSSDQLSTWEGAFARMYTGYSDLSYTLWGAPAQGNRITVQTSGSMATLTCEECGEDEVIQDLSIDVIDSSLLWIGMESGMYYYNSSSQTWGQYKVVDERTNAFFRGHDFVYAATSLGIHTIDGDDDSSTLYPGDSCSVLEIIGDDKTTPEVEDAITKTVWHVTDGEVCRNGVPLELQPGEVADGIDVACSLDVDLSGYIWCGKYRWDGSDWYLPEGLDETEVVKSVASREGLVYFLTLSGALLRW